MRKMKKLVILVLACLCVMACALGFASCEDETSNQSVGLSFVINEDGESYSVRGIGTCEERDIVIPATYKNKPVTGIEPLCFQRITSINSVTIPNSVTTIGEGAFYYCNSLTNVVIPDSVTTIGLSTFSNCSKLASVTIGKGVTSIEDGVFSRCGLKSVIIPDSVTSIGASAFNACSNLTSVTIGESVTSINDNAFQYCYKLVEVYNKSSLNITKNSTAYGYIGIYAKEIYTQSYTSKLSTDENGYTLYTDGDVVSLIGYDGEKTDLTLPSKITEINQYALAGCTELLNVIIGNNVTSIGDYAFQYCESLKSVTFGDSVTSIGKSAFSYCNSLKRINITSVEAWCGMSGLGSFVSSGVDLYINDKLITELVIPDSVTSIGDYAFQYCDSLISLTIGDNVTSIGRSAFQYCDNLTSVTIGESVTSVGSYAFAYCYKLVEVYNKSSLNITKGSSNYGSIGNYAKEVSTTSYSSKISIDENGYILYTNGSLVSLISYMGSKTDLILPSKITEINQYAFKNCDQLTSVKIGNKVTSIGSDAFASCNSLTSVTIGNKVNSIGSYAFASCNSLTSVTIPESVTLIGEYAFRDCTSLTSITFTGTYAQWEAIQKGYNWNYGVLAEKVVCLGGVAI